MQLKLVNKDTLKTQNIISFVNLPAARSTDVNFQTMVKILNKQQNFWAQLLEKIFLSTSQS